MGKAALQLVGQRFGKLVVLSQAENKAGYTYWNCLCDCGKETIKKGRNLTKGHTNSCSNKGGKKSLQLAVGQRFGKLVVLSQAENKRGATYWNCLCDCGKEKTINGSDLKGGTKSCGCLKKERFRKSHPRSAIKSIYRSYKKAARERGYNFTLTNAKVGELIQQPCFYCGIEHSNKHTNFYAKEFVFHYNGLDRKDNNLGYTSNNVVPCCKICNQWKKALTLKEFRDHIFRLTKNYSSWAS